MDIYRLKSEELTYELNLRGIDATDMTVDDKRKMLRSKILLESRDPTLIQKYNIIDRDPDTEINTCKAKLEELGILVEQYINTQLTNTYSKANARLLHLFHRIRHIKINEENKPTVKQLDNRCLEIMDALQQAADETRCQSDSETEEIREDNPQMNRTTLPTETTRAREGETQDVSNLQTFVENIRRLNLESSPAAHHTQSSLVKSVPVCKWNVYFDGDLKKMGVNSFLERVEELRVARNISYPQLLNSAIDLFRGQALIWYRAIRQKLKTWEELVTELKYTFLPEDYDDVLWNEIRARYQGGEEKSSVYIAVMTNLFNRLTIRPSEWEQLKLIRKNH